VPKRRAKKSLKKQQDIRTRFDAPKNTMLFCITRRGLPESFFGRRRPDPCGNAEENAPAASLPRASGLMKKRNGARLRAMHHVAVSQLSVGILHIKKKLLD
jgi:hypothetical protein